MYISIYIYIYVYTDTYIYTHTHTYIHTYILMCIPTENFSVTLKLSHIYIHIYTYIHTYIYTYINIYIYMYIQIHRDTHTHTYIHTNLLMCFPIESLSVTLKHRHLDFTTAEPLTSIKHVHQTQLCAYSKKRTIKSHINFGIAGFSLVMSLKEVHLWCVGNGLDIPRSQ